MAVAGEGAHFNCQNLQHPHQNSLSWPFQDPNCLLEICGKWFVLTGESGRKRMAFPMQMRRNHPSRAQRHDHTDLPCRPCGNHASPSESEAKGATVIIIAKPSEQQEK